MPIEAFLSNVISKCIFEDEMFNIFFMKFRSVFLTIL